MSESKHTPGPWHVGELAPGKPYVFVDEEREIARLYDKRGSFPQASIEGHQYLYGGQAEANARLIAAAPEMLDALHAARDTILQLYNMRGCEAEGLPEDWVGFIDAALAKAEAN